MLFEVIGPDKQPKMGTDEFKLVPWENISSMAQAGCIFKWEGKFISKSALIKKACIESYETLPSSEYKILCVETGSIYDKQSAAARDMNIDPAQVSDSIRTGRPRSGYTFKKVLV